MELARQRAKPGKSSPDGMACVNGFREWLAWIAPARSHGTKKFLMR
jgi:hypothetical protein